MSNIDVKEIPRSTGYMIAESLFTAISEYFSDPQHQKEFEEWDRYGRDAGKKCDSDNI